MNSFIVVSVVSLILALLSSCIWFKSKNIIEGAVLGIVLFFSSHILCSMGLFVIDKFTVFRAIALTMCFLFLVLGLVVFKRRDSSFSIAKIFPEDFSIKNMLIPIIICCVAVPLVLLKNEIFGMGQDEGVYQVVAMNFMNGITDRQQDFNEYHLLETDEEKSYYHEVVKSYLTGYDIPSENFPDSVYDYDVSKVSGIYHGIPTYASLLAFWGTLFGMENMFDIQTVFFICMIFLVYFICRNLKLKTSSCIVATIIPAISPVILWVAKSTLTEMFLDIIMLMFLYFLCDEENPQNRWLSIIPIVIFGCFHVSIFTILPLFFLIYAGLFVFTREKQFAVLMPVSIIVYMISYFSMVHIQPVYTMNNYRDVFVGFINVNNLTTVITVVCSFGIICSAIFGVVLLKFTKTFNSDEFTLKAQKSKLFNVLLAILIIAPTLYIGFKAITKFNSWEEISHLTLMGFIGSTGYFLIPVAMIFFLFRTKHFIKNNSRLVIFLAFFYCVLVYSALLRYQIQYYFYYSRYLVPFIPIATIFSVICLDKIGGKILYPLTGIAVLMLYPHNNLIANYQDDTRMEWDILEDISQLVDDNDCIVIEKYYASTLWLQLKSNTGADIYPYDPNSENQFLNLSQNYDNIFYITNESFMNDSTSFFATQYVNKVNHIEDDLNNTGSIVPMSIKYWETKDNIFVYTYEGYKFNYPVKEYYATNFTGLGNLENDFCWSMTNSIKARCILLPDDYTMTLELGCALPESALNENGFKIIDVSVNENYVGNLNITKENNGNPISISIPKEFFIDGYNTISLDSNLWSAELVNPADNRKLGIPLKSISFEVQD